MDGLAIESEGLSKTFGEHKAVRDLTLRVRRGTAFGFLGPNAGKSTSVKMLLGLVEPTGGTAKLLGRPMGDRAVRARIGFLPEHFRFYDWLSASELVTLHGRLCGLPERTLRLKVPALLERVGLGDQANKQIRDFSKGMMQRVGLAQAIVNDPEILFLDEPTSGLDPAGRKLVRDIIAEQQRRGATVFLNSHLLGEVEQSCDRVAFIKEGAVLGDYEMGEWQQGCRPVELRVGGLTREIVARVKLAAEGVRWTGERLALSLADEQEIPPLVRMLVESGAKVFAVVPQRKSLEELFLETVGTEPGL